MHAEKSKLEITPIFGAANHSIITEFLGMPPHIKEKLSQSIKK